MPEWLQNLIAQIRALPPGRQAVLGASAVGSLAFFLWLVSGVAAPAWQPLYQGLSGEEASRVVEALEAQQFDVRLADGGETVEVPATDAARARIALAGEGLPSGSGASFELFDEPAFGVTDFVHRVNYMRALRGELARSIQTLEPVERARVQLVMPEQRSVLDREERSARASVVVKLRSGRQLGPEQARSVVHLVASSVEALEPSQVTVVDDAGRLLAPRDQDGPGGLATAGGGRQARLEARLASRVEELLERTVGVGNVAARVRAEMDWRESETTEELYDPDSQVARSEETTTESSSEGGPPAEGTPGVTANAPDAGGNAAQGEGSGGGSRTRRTTETVNYEISKTVRRERTPRGRVERLSVAVLVADPVPGGGGQGGGEDAPQRQPWDEESLQEFERLARQAVGFDAERGDRITVTSAPFRVPGGKLEDGGGFLRPEWLGLLSPLLRGLAVLLAVLAFGRFVVSPLARAVGTEGGGTALPARVSELQGEEGGGAAAAAAQIPTPPPSLAEQIGSAVGSRTDDSVRTIRNWLNQG